MAFSLEEALISGADACRRSAFLTFISETPYIDDPDDHEEEATLPLKEATLPLEHATETGQSEDCLHESGGRFVLHLKQGRMSHSQCLEFLCTNGPTFMARSVDDKHHICSVLLMMANKVKRAPRLAAEVLPAWDMLDMSMWYKSLYELMKEMKMVQEQSPLLIGNSDGIYVVTSAPDNYAAFLRALAVEVADRCG